MIFDPRGLYICQHGVNYWSRHFSLTNAYKITNMAVTFNICEFHIQVFA